MLRSLLPQISSRMPFSTVAAACVHGRAHVRPVFVQATAAERRRTKTIKKQAKGLHCSPSGPIERSSGFPVVGAAGPDVAVTYPNISGDFWSTISLILAIRGPLLQRTLWTSLRMILYRAFKAYATSDTEQMMQLDPSWLGHPKYSELHDYTERKGSKLTNKDVRDWLRQHPQHLRDMGIDPESSRMHTHDIDHILALGAKDPDNSDRSDHPINLFVMPSGLNSSFGGRISLAKCQYVGLQVWCAVLCWHVLKGVGGMQLSEATQLAHHMAASLADLLERAGALAAIA